jgi:Outer membrane protein beta-barrel domain
VMTVFKRRIICTSIVLAPIIVLKENPVPLFRLVVVALALITITSVPVRADGYIVPFVGFNFGGDSSSNCTSLTDCKQKRLNLGVSLVSMGPVFGLEEDISYAKNFFGETPGLDNSVFSAMSNLVIGVGVGPVRPYVVGGIGLIRPHVSSLTSSVTSLGTGKNAFGYDLGGGVAGLFGKHLGVRGDIRRLRTIQDVNVLIFTGQKLEFWRASAGLVLAF